MPKRQTLIQMLEERYDDHEVVDALQANIKELGTADKIVRGELTLPSAQDASHWHRRITGRDRYTEEQYQDKQKVVELEKQVDALNEAFKKGPNIQYVEELKKRISALEAKK